MDDQVQQGINAYKAGNHALAREYLQQAVILFPDNERAWGYLFNVSVSDQQRLRCLRQMARINPGNSKTAAKLAQFESLMAQNQPEQQSAQIGRAHV